jgi:hypothetical protein
MYMRVKGDSLDMLAINNEGELEEIVLLGIENVGSVREGRGTG